MKKKKAVLLVALLAFSVAALGGLVAVVYAKYITSLSVSGGARIAKWNFEDENSAGTATCQLTPNSVVSGTIANGTPDIIAPGTSGTCTLQLTNSTSEVAVDYTVTIDQTPSASQNIPKNLVINNGSIASFTDTGTIAINGTKTITVNWAWPYETGTDATIASEDDEDTSDGENAYDGQNAMTLVFSIEGVQHNPTQAMPSNNP